MDGDNIGLALTETLHNAIEAELQRQQQPAHHFVNFALTAHGFMHAYQTGNFTVGEFLQRTARLDEMLAKLASKLNSNESFNPERGFQVDVVFVSMPGPGSGHGNNYNPGRWCLDKENKKKRCIITIKNRDALCCACAIVTMRVHCHKGEGSVGIRCNNGKPRNCITKRGIDLGPCRLEELRQFQHALGPQYQLLVMTRMKPFFFIFKGSTAPHQIRLLKSNHHFDGCMSFPAFVNHSYYCLDCEKGFNTNDGTHHSCQDNRCRVCGRFDCLDYVRGTRPSNYCTHCHNKFYGAQCKRHHFVTKLCQTMKTCLQCQAQYTVVKGQCHRCEYAKCYIQLVVQEEKKPEEEGEGSMEMPPPLFVYAHFKAECRGHLRRQFVCQKSRSQGHCQVNAQQVYPFRFFYFSFLVLPILMIPFCLAVSGANLVNVSINTPPSPSKIHLICSAYCPITPSTSVPSDCVPTIFWRLSIPVCMTMPSRAPRPISSLLPSRPVTLGSNFMSR